MLADAFDQACTTADGKLDKTHPLEIRMLDAGDHAIEWGVFYYTKDVSGLVATRQLLMETILEASIEHNISLATPNTHVVTRSPLT